MTSRSLVLARIIARHHGRLRWLWLGVWVSSLLTTRVQAQLPPVSVQAGVTCLDSQMLADKLAPLLSSTRIADDLSIEVQGSVHDPRTAVARLRHGEEVLAERTFSPGPPRCADFHDALALALALMLKSQQAPAPRPLDTPTRAMQRQPTPEPTPGPALREVTPTPVQPTEVVPFTLSLRTAGLVSRGVLARRAAGLQVELGLERARVSLQTGLLALYSSEQQLQNSQVYFRARPLAATLQLCAVLVHHARSTLRACAGLLAGRVRLGAAESRTVRARAPESPAWLALQVRIELVVRLGAHGSAFLSVAPVYGGRTLGVEAGSADDEPPRRARLSRLGALLVLGLAFDVFRQGIPRSGHP